MVGHREPRTSRCASWVSDRGTREQIANIHWIIALIFHASKVMVKTLHANIMWTKNFQMSKLDLEKE